MENTLLVKWMSRVIRQFLWAMHWIPKHIESLTKHHWLLKSIHIVFYETNSTLRKGVIANDDADFEDQIVEEPKEKDQKDSKEDPPLEELQRKEN